MNRNVVIDIAKYVAAILVVAIHTRPMKDISPEIDFFMSDIVCRFAVPFFIVCTGFYISLLGGQSNFYLVARRSLYNIAKLYILWSLIYLILLTHNWIKNDIDITWFAYIGWIKGVFISYSYYHLWYLISMCYGIFLFIFIKYIINDKFFVFIAIILWLLQVIWYSYDDYFHILPVCIDEAMNSFPAFFNGLTLMLPLLLVGNLIKKSYYRLSDTFMNTGLFISVAGLITEAYLLTYFGVLHTRVSFILFTLPCAFFIFSYLYRLGEQRKFKCSFSKNFSSISLIVYCVHPLIIEYLNYFNYGAPMWLFIFSSIISTLVGLTYILIKHKFKEMKL